MYSTNITAGALLAIPLGKLSDKIGGRSCIMLSGRFETGTSYGESDYSFTFRQIQ